MTGTPAEAKRTAPTGERFEPTFMHGRIIEAEHLARYAWAAQFARGRRALDAACGMAYGTNMLMDAGATAVVGVDLDPDVLAEVRPSAREGITFEAADLRKLPFADDEFDLITCFEAIEHVPDPEIVLDELRRVLRPEGLVALSTPNRDVYTPGNPFHLRELTPNELEEELRQRFAHVVLRRQHTWVASGIFDDETFRAGENERVAAGQVLKASRNEPGEETYTLALASDAEVPPDGSVIDLSSDIDLREWGERLTLADHAIEVAPGDGELVREAETRRLQDELLGLREQLVRSEAEAAHYADLSAKLQQAQAALVDYMPSAAIVNSRSWKMTSPLRKLGGAIRKRRS